MPECDDCQGSGMDEHDDICEECDGSGWIDEGYEEDY